MRSIIRIVLVSFLLPALFASLVVLTHARTPMAGIIFTVNSSADLPDAAAGDGVCEATPGMGDCTLRAATMEANTSSDFTIKINLPAGIYNLVIPAIDPEDDAHGSIKIHRSLTITGAGSYQTFIDGNALVTFDRTIEVLSSSVGSAITIQGVTIQDGTASEALAGGARGGGLYARLGDETGASGTLVLQDVLFRRNSALGAAASGGGLYLEGWSQSAYYLTNVVISDNAVETDGYAGGGLQFESGDYQLGKPYSSLVIEDSTLQNNRATPFNSGNPWGGAMDICHGLVTLAGSTLANCLADYAGAISVDGELSHLDLINSTLSGNQADFDGGGIYALDGFTSLSSATLMGNNSDYDLNGSGQGGGIFQTGSASVSLANSLVVYNHETYFDPEQQIYVPRHGDLRGAYTTEGYNAFSQTFDSTFDGSHELDRDDISLEFIGRLAFNGGNTLTRALLASSEAINAANPAGCNDPYGNPLLTDQRGFPRQIDGGCDIGAYEFNPVLYLPAVRR